MYIKISSLEIIDTHLNYTIYKEDRNFMGGYRFIYTHRRTNQYCEKTQNKHYYYIINNVY
jgi:hypothetical protein